MLDVRRLGLHLVCLLTFSYLTIDPVTAESVLLLPLIGAPVAPVAPVNLTNHPARDLRPAWSPDGSKIAFVSDRDGNEELFVMDADGSNVLQLTHNLDFPFATDESWRLDQSPIWSPDGSQIAFVHSACMCNGARGPDHENGMYVVKADGSKITLVSRDVFTPQWSPDGAMFVYRGPRDYAQLQSSIYTMNADGSNQKFLTEGDEPAWSRSGNKIAFISDQGGFPLVVIDPDGSNRHNLTTHSAYEPIWSPDGSQIAYWHFNGPPNYDDQLYVIDADGNNPLSLHKLRGSGSGNDVPTWSPNGSQLAYYSVDRFTGPQGLYLTSVDGKTVIWLTAAGGGEDRAPTWSHDGNMLAFSNFVRTNDSGNEDIFVIDLPKP